MGGFVKHELPDLDWGFEPWPHQSRTVRAIYQSLRAGAIDLACVACPTGGGKTRMMVMVARLCEHLGLRCILYTHRKMLRAQASGVFSDHGIEHGVRAAGTRPDLDLPMQISSFDTERSRTLSEANRWETHRADVVLIDEAHANTHPTAQTLISDHLAGGAQLVCGFTATPVSVDLIYNRLIVAASTSELRACGALVKCLTYGPTEPDRAHIRRNVKTGEYSEGAVRKAIRCDQIFGRVVEHYRKLNPAEAPSILFAPGVAESQWFAEEFARNGITAAHIDHETSDERREEILAQSKAGEVKVVCNRFVLREGVDAPWLAHGIMATAFGGLSNYLQAGGRLLRASPGLESVTLQDHGGNWHEHGSLNEDRYWKIEDTNTSLRMELTKAREAEKGDASTEPICCPQCHGVRKAGRGECPYCGHRHKRSVRLVMQADGELKRAVGRVVKHRPEQTDYQKIWSACYYANLKGKSGGKDRTLNQIAAQFRQRAQDAVPFADDGGPMLRNCPERGSVWWGMSVHDYHNRNRE